MWYTILITLVVDFGGLLLVYVLLRDRVRRAASADSRIAEIRDEVSRLLVELNQATDRNIALMEDKIAVLNEAISTADKKIGLLRRETEKHDVGSQIYSRLAEGRPLRSAASPMVDFSAQTADAAPAEAETRSVRERADRGARGDRTVPAASPKADLASPKADSAPPLSVELSERAESADVRQRVMMLHRAGFSPSLIASRVGAPVGEVELIISLEQRKGQA
jgi:hypothetical protein